MYGLFSTLEDELLEDKMDSDRPRDGSVTFVNEG
jgi:hypothetical protein